MRVLIRRTNGNSKARGRTMDDARRRVSKHPSACVGPHGRVYARWCRTGRSPWRNVEVDPRRRWMQQWRRMRMLSLDWRWRQGQWRRSELQALDARHHLLHPCSRLRGALKQRTHGLLRLGVPSLKRTQLVEGCRHHLLEALELGRHDLHRLLQ